MPCCKTTIKFLATYCVVHFIQLSKKYEPNLRYEKNVLYDSTYNRSQFQSTRDWGLGVKSNNILSNYVLEISVLVTVSSILGSKVFLANLEMF